MKKFSELAINNPEQILDSVARATQNGFVAYNLDNKITHFSPMMEEVTGWIESEMLGKDISELFLVQDPKVLGDPYQVSSHAVNLFTRDGKQINLQTRKAGIVNNDGELEGHLMFFVIEDYNKDLDRAQSEFISTVSHELRTPITSIKGFASTLLSSKQKLDEAKRKKYTKIIKDQAERLSRLVEDLLAVSRLESRKLQLTIHPVKIKPIIENVSEVVNSKYGFSHKVSVKAAKKLPEVWVDADRLEQILTNLIDNAIKYSPEADKVDIEISKSKLEDKAMVLVSITDHGIGIDKDDLSKIFTKFSRLDNPLTRSTEGTGLGLYISRSLARLLGGDLKAINNPGGPGTTFCLYLSTESHKGGEVWWD